MNLYVWQPKGHGEFSWFVMANTEKDAREYVHKEMIRRNNLVEDNDYMDSVSSREMELFNTDYYTLTIVSVGQVVVNSND